MKDKKYYCPTCCYRNRDVPFCGFCMQKVLDETKERNSTLELKDNKGEKDIAKKI